MDRHESDKKVRVLDERLLSSYEKYSPGIEVSVREKLPDGRIISKTIEAEPHTFTTKQSNLSRRSWDTLSKVGDFRIARSRESGRIACFKASTGRFISWMEGGDMVKLALDLLQSIGVKRYKTKDGRIQFVIPKSLTKSLTKFESKSADFPSRSRVIVSEEEGDNASELS